LSEAELENEISSVEDAESVMASSTQSKDISSHVEDSPLDVDDTPPLQEVKMILKQKNIKYIKSFLIYSSSIKKNMS
jgi:hypothetical protein